jgi:hypothetical protein
VSESWGKAFVKAIPLAIWIFALALTAIVGTYEWSRWRGVAEQYEVDLDPRPRVVDEYPDYHEDAQKRVAEATSGLRGVKRELHVDMAIFAAVMAGLIALPFVYRRLLPPGARPTRRSWLLAVPLLVLFAVLVVVWVGMAMRGAITG